MPSEHQLLSEIENHAQALAQAVASAEFWHGRTLETMEGVRTADEQKRADRPWEKTVSEPTQERSASF